MWLTEDAGVFGVVIIFTAIVATLVALYFDWRKRVVRRLLGETRSREMEKAA